MDQSEAFDPSYQRVVQEVRMLWYNCTTIEKENCTVISFLFNIFNNLCYVICFVKPVCPGLWQLAMRVSLALNTTGRLCTKCA
jgi:hypothetical protein